MPQEYDLYGPDLFANPYPLYQKLRSTHPVHLDGHMGCWVVTQYADVVKALANRDFSSERTMHGVAVRDPQWQELQPLFERISLLMFYSDPPRHTKIRSLMSKALSARMVEQWRPHIQQVVDEYLDLVQDKGQMDVIADLAFPLPARIITDMLGIRPQERVQFRTWSADLADFLGNPPSLAQCKRLDQSMQQFMAYFRPLVARQYAHPQNDLIGALVQAEERGVVLTEDEVLVNCIGLLVGGHETTANLIGNGLLALLRHPEALQLLRMNPQLIESAVEEFLRYDCPVQFMARVARQTTEIGGKKIYKGQSVMLMLGAANRDPLQFPDPERLDICRQENRHLAFGHNIHFCIGAALARLEAQIAIATVLRRMPQLHLTPGPLQWRENLSFHGLKTLSVLF